MQATNELSTYLSTDVQSIASSNPRYGSWIAMSYFGRSAEDSFWCMSTMTDCTKKTYYANLILLDLQRTLPGNLVSLGGFCVWCSLNWSIGCTSGLDQGARWDVQVRVVSLNLLWALELYLFMAVGVELVELGWMGRLGSSKRLLEQEKGLTPYLP